MQLLQVFSNHYIHGNNAVKGGRPRRVPDCHCILGMLLSFYTDKMSYKTLSVMFGVPATTLSRYLNDAKITLLKALKLIPEAQFRWPSLEEQRI